IAVLLIDLIEQRHLEPSRAVIQHHAHALPALSDLIDESGDTRGLARVEAAALAATERPLAQKIPDARGDEARQVGLEAVDRMSRQIQAERLALAREPHPLA